MAFRLFCTLLFVHIVRSTKSLTQSVRNVAIPRFLSTVWNTFPGHLKRIWPNRRWKSNRKSNGEWAHSHGQTRDRRMRKKIDCIHPNNGATNRHSRVEKLQYSDKENSIQCNADGREHISIGCECKQHNKTSFIECAYALKSTHTIAKYRKRVRLVIAWITSMSRKFVVNFTSISFWDYQKTIIRIVWQERGINYKN